MSVADHYYLAFNDGETTHLLCDAATGKGLRCTHEGVANIQFGANCSEPISFNHTEDVVYPNKLNATLGKAYCTLEGEDMEMTLRLEFDEYVASHHDRLISVNSEGSYPMLEWEVTEQ